MRNALTYEEYNNDASLHIGHVWFYFTEWDFVIMAPPKCGSSTIKQFVWVNELEDRVRFLKQNEVRKLKCEKYVVVRDPLDRFASLWKSKCRDKGNIAQKGVNGMSPHELMQHIMAGHKDAHWTPQSEMIGSVEVSLIALENLNDWWESNGYGKLEVHNSTTGEMLIDETIHAWLRDYYAEDFMLFCDLLST